MNKRKKSKIAIFFLIAFLSYCAYTLIEQEFYLNEYRKQENYYKSEVLKEEKLTVELEKQKELYQTDFFIEKTAREKLGMVKPGEKVFKRQNQSIHQQGKRSKSSSQTIRF